METSQSVAALAKALANFQGESTNPPKNAKAEVGKYTYTYATLPDIITHVRPLLKKHGLSIVQSATNDTHGIGVQTILMHDSGEWIKSDTLTLPLQAATPQVAGGAVTYARRYSLAAILGIASDDDDDAAIATHHAQQNPPASNPISAKSESTAKLTEAATGEKATEKQVKFMFALMQNADLTPLQLGAYIEDKYSVKSSRELSKGQISDIIKGLQDGSIKQAVQMMEFGVEVPDEQGGDAV